MQTRNCGCLNSFEAIKLKMNVGVDIKVSFMVSSTGLFFVVLRSGYIAMITFNVTVEMAMAHVYPHLQPQIFV